METNSPNDFDALTAIISSLKKLSKSDQQRTLQAVATFLDISMQGNHGSSAAPRANIKSSEDTNHLSDVPTFSEDRALSPKDFMRDKAPRTDVERVACLGYYLTHYRSTPHFKTLDISTLNTEAAQPKFSSASVAVDNATKAGLFVQAIRGSKQISSAGEVYVQLLPDREAAKAGIQGIRQKRKLRKPSIKKPMGTQ